MGRYKTFIKCNQIHRLLVEKKYTKALEILDTIDLYRVHSISDLNQFAEVYLKAERYEDAKELYFAIYEKHKTRRVTFRLIELLVRTRELDTAEDLYQEYLKLSPDCSDKFEIRYRIDKAKGENIKVLIDSLNHLKRVEYSEEWGLELAKLYYIEDMYDECKKECDDLQLWFGEGVIVDKAKILNQLCCSCPTFERTEEKSIDEMIQEGLLRLKTVENSGEDLTAAVAEEETEPMVSDQKEEDVFINISKLLERSSDDIPVTQEPEPEPEKKDFQFSTVKQIFKEIGEENDVHFAFFGGEKNLTIALAKRIAKELQMKHYLAGTSIAKISSEKLNHLSFTEHAKKLIGCCVLIEHASELSEQTINDMEVIMEQYTGQIVIMLSDEKEKMEELMNRETMLCDKIRYLLLL